MAKPLTVVELLAAGGADAPAIAAPGRRPLGFGELATQVALVRETLNAAGLGRNDRIAIVLPNGPEMAGAFLAIAACATTAPLNPAYTETEFDFYLGDLGAKALLVEAGAESPAIAVARRRGIPLIMLNADADAAAGRFALDAPLGVSHGAAAAADGPARPEDIALVLHTSGTTSRPKIVPLTHANICASARNIGATLALGPADRCLNVMPLFHIHGLIAAVLASLGAGGSVFCAPGFNALKFFAWMDRAHPSWYSAVPTMHQAILARAGRNGEIIARNPLRFVRSSSASLPPQVMAALEQAFGAPVIEAYGMTEAAHQMASNPLPPRPRKTGSVGPAAGPEVAIMDPAGRLVAPGAVGEIVIRGANVTPGYENNAAANAENFTNGWFRTGDQGFLDGDGYVTISGRLKEIINRGGEKISPREVDEVLMGHPGVAQAVTFALPHDKLGEEVAAAVVPRQPGAVDAAALRAFATARLADFKVPRRIVLVAEIPKGPTGKLQRIGLAEKLGLTA